ncbi:SELENOPROTEIN T [Salix viminalis]|uniref:SELENOPROTEIN T n=1 Tax=Salix viminalis TaxID=40686 RepID=A0A9Q0NJ17_SALVM|nr:SELENOPROTEIN T [Salix viminalis]
MKPQDLQLRSQLLEGLVLAALSELTFVLPALTDPLVISLGVIKRECGNNEKDAGNAVGVMGIVLGGEQIFPMIGLMAPPPWYYTLRANKFGTIASTWLLGNALQSFLQSSGAFEVYCNDELVFSKLMEARFPGEIELKDLVGRRLANSGISEILP